MLCFALVEFLQPVPALASSLLAGSAGSADSAAAGATVAEPLTPLGAQFSNPAGLAGFTERKMGTSLGLAYGRGVVTADVPAGYHAENEVLVPFFNTTLVVPWGRWTFGISSMGTSGARFDYGARPELGVNDGFFSESGILGIAIGGAYRVSDSLWLGAEIVPLYGSTHLRFSREVAEAPGASTPFRFTVDGFGVQAMFGVTWKPDENWSLGLGARPPGRIWTSGDTKFGAGKQDVDLELEAPAEVGLGITRGLFTAWKLSYGVRFLDSSVLSKSYIRYEQTPSANTPFVSDARDEWRHALGLEYAWSESLALLGGVSKANGIVGSKGTMPSSYDSRDWRLSTGVIWKGETWEVDGMFGYLFAGSRRVSAEDAMVFPGKYDSKPAYILSATVLRKF
ncbi:MAG: OmpP1/FadL family transporter [Candidatus Binatia bacterium]